MCSIVLFIGVPISKIFLYSRRFQNKYNFRKNSILLILQDKTNTSLVSQQEEILKGVCVGGMPYITRRREWREQ